MRFPARWRIVVAGALGALLLAAWLGPLAFRQAGRTSGSARETGAGRPNTRLTETAPAGIPSETATNVLPPAAADPEFRGKLRMYAYYYTWWSRKHWTDKLGPNFPVDASPLPLPAKVDGCKTENLYEGNQLTDVPGAIYSQDDPGVIERHVRDAVSAGLAGFIVNWRGNGRAGQAPGDSRYSLRLDEMFRAVRKVRAEGVPFSLWLDYKASASRVPVREIVGDLTYLERRYAKDPALDRHWSRRPILLWGGSRKYPVSTIRTVSERFRSNFFLMGDENWRTWGDGRAQYFDGNQYYWSSQNPYTNPRSGQQLASLASMVRSSAPNSDGSPKLWFAPLTPGYDAQLLTGSDTCVPRNSEQTLRKIFEMNSATNPDGWVLISWNEIAEGTYVEPLQRHGRFYLDALAQMVR